MNDFWERCVKANCFVAPLVVYSDYNPELGFVEEQVLEKDKLGIRYVALPIDEYVVVYSGSSWSILIDEYIDQNDLHETPEAALIYYENKSGRYG